MVSEASSASSKTAPRWAVLDGRGSHQLARPRGGQMTAPGRFRRCSHPMWDGCRLVWSQLIGLFRARATLEAENLVLRQQIIVLRRTAPKRLSLGGFDRLIFVTLYPLFADVRSALAIVRPETVIRWHRAGFLAYWRWKSRPRWGRPSTASSGAGSRRICRCRRPPNTSW
jgi:hypothetical protein